MGSERSPLSLVSGPPAPAAEGEVSFQRLEYGKLCTTHDGAIEPGVESYPLATSPEFSPLVEPFCRPWLVGVGADMVPGVRHGTVLRCIRIQGRPVPIFCRLRQRPEGGEGAEGRRFWLGRYIYAGTVDPLTGLRALEERPLRGITVQEARQKGWAPIIVPRSPRPEADPLLAGFLQAALEHILSGIPVGVSRAPDEAAFFHWATVLWQLLPDPLRPVFSAGWAVTPDVAQALHFSWSPERASTVALADVDRGTWAPPERVEKITPNGEVRSRSFQEDLLVPGRMFLRESFGWSGGRVRLAGVEPRLDHLRGFDFAIRGSDSEPAWVVDARSSWSWDRLRRPGMRSLDHARFQLVERWLQGAPAGDPEALCLSTKAYFFPDSRWRLLELGLGALETPGLRSRADQIVWRSLAEDLSSHPLLDQIPLPEQATSRVRLLQAVALGDLPRILEALGKARESGGCADLPQAALDRMWEALSRSLDDTRLLAMHRNLLKDTKVVEPYRGWAVASAVQLAVMLGTALEPGSPEALSRLRKLADHPVITTLRRFQKSEPPAEEDVRALGSLDAESAGRLGARLIGLWKLRDLETRKRRESLCPWLEALPTLPAGDLLVSLLDPSAETERLPPEERATLAEEIRCDHVPPTLQARVAALVLREWVHFHGYHQDDGNRNSGWGAVFKQWPPAAVPALADAVSGASRPEIDPAVHEALTRLSLPSSFLDKRIETHLQRRKDSKLYTDVARLLWDLCARAIQHPGGVWITDICHGLAHGELPAGDPTPPEDSKLDAAVRLASPHLLSLPPGLWESARQGWQIRFLLEVAPRADLQPTTEQRVALLPFRSWLKKHLDDGGIHADRETHFGIASRSFHQGPYDAKQWRPEYSESPLWAAFRGVPLKLQGNLRKALETYSAGEGHFTKSLVKNATRYFEETDFAYLSAEEKRDFLERLARAAIAPLMRDGRLSPSHADPLIEAADPRPRPVMFRHRTEIQFHEDVYNALDLSEDGEVIVVAKWFKPLLDRIWNRRCQDDMVKAIHKVAPEVWRN